MVNYGTGSNGDRIVSTNETETLSFMDYKNLTVESGATLTVPARTRLQVSDTLTINGTIVVQNDISGGGGSGNGGNSGGNLAVVAKTIAGNGTVKVNGEDGDSVTNDGNGSSGSSGAGYGIPSGASGNQSGGGQQGRESSRDNENGNTGYNNNAGTAYSGGSMYSDGQLKQYFEDYLISGAYITQSPMDILLPGSGGGGGGGGYESFYPTTNSNYSAYRANVGGGGGGAGGSFVTAGGYGGGAGSNRFDGNNVDDSNSTQNHRVYGGDGGAGGGSGGFILIATENMSTDITWEAMGGDGGDGYIGRLQHDGNNYNAYTKRADIAGGGGGGGSGGALIAFTDKTPTAVLDKGVAGKDGTEVFDGTYEGNAGSSDGTDGNPGVMFTFDIEELKN